MLYIEKEIIQKLPLDYKNPSKSTITLFARDIYEEKNEQAEILLFFNGGPGFSCVRDWRNTAWVIEALKTHRVILLDQRGTGRSQPIDRHMLDQFNASQDLCDYLAYFRADNIVRDAEFLREHVFKRDKITILGQSFGGFIVLSYLSFAPQSLRGALITAGIPPLTENSVESIYRVLWKNVLERNQRYYAQYPQDKIRVERIISLLKEPERFLDLGIYFGQEGGFDIIHYLLDEAFCDEEMTQLSWRFEKRISELTGTWETSPLYAVLHESIYCQDFASQWGADRAKPQGSGFFAGEMVREKMFQDYEGLHAFKEAAHLLAQKNDWPALYDWEKLAKNTVPVEALLLTDDFYVNIDLAQATASKINNLNVWEHKTWQHDALRKHGEEVVGALLNRLRGRVTY